MNEDKEFPTGFFTSCDGTYLLPGDVCEIPKSHCLKKDGETVFYCAEMEENGDGSYHCCLNDKST